MLPNLHDVSDCSNSVECHQLVGSGFMVVSPTLRPKCQRACDLKLCQIGTGMSQGDCNTKVDLTARTGHVQKWLGLSLCWKTSHENTNWLPWFLPDEYKLDVACMLTYNLLQLGDINMDASNAVSVGSGKWIKKFTEDHYDLWLQNNDKILKIVCSVIDQLRIIFRQ